ALDQHALEKAGATRSKTEFAIYREATASVSLRNEEDHLPADGIYLGVRTLDLEWGVCPHAIRLFTGHDTSRVIDTENITANRTRNIIRDFTSENFYKNRPYVLDWPYFRFYAEVPLYSPSGYVLGSYCVVDDKTRTEFGDKEVIALQEIADAIAQHLENVRVVHYHHRAENLVKGLTKFVKGHPEFDSPDSFSQLAASTETLSFHNPKLPSNDIQSTELDTLLPASKSLSNESVGRSSSTTQEEGVSSLFSEMKGSQTTLPSTQPSSLAPGSPKLTALIGPGENFSGSAVDDVPVAERLSAIFSRASELLRASMDLSGVAFLDARQSGSQFDLSDGFGDCETLSEHGDSGLAIDPRPWLLGHSAEKSLESPERLCRPLDHISSMLPTEPPNTGPFTIQEDLLETLIKNFPSGHIFNMDDEPRGPETMQRQTSRRLAYHLPDAKSVLFFPLWDWNKSHWLAGTLVWTQDSHRPLGMEELHYFKAFGDSIISEVSRVHWRATEKSKFDFVSSINHELRSPLHGILGSAELLQSTPLQPSQHDMVKMVETSGLTLLDTIDHLLDYCKINDLATTKKSGSHRVEREVTGRTSDFDLGILIEEVGTFIYARHKAQPVTIPARNSIVAASANETRHQLPSSSDELSTVIRIEMLDSWTVRSNASAWRRILINLIDNAMKWTMNGLVEVTLSKVRSENKHGFSYAHLCVRDTGSGISRDYLKDSLFTPFAQEDSLSPGVGLGLSIVHKLVISLDGTVDVRSELGVGTQVDIYIPVAYLDRTHPAELAGVCSSIPKTPTPQTSVRACLLGLNGHPSLNEIPTGILSSEAKRKFSVQNALVDVLMTRMGWQLSLAKSPTQEHGDVVVIEEADFHHMLTEGLLHATDPDLICKFFIVLGGKTSFLTDDLPANVIRVSQPFGPKSLHDAAEQFMKINKAPLQFDATDFAPNSSLLITHQHISSLPTRKGSINKSRISVPGCSSADASSLDRPEFIVQKPSLNKNLNMSSLWMIMTSISRSVKAFF
ncbi:hypothetical protein N7510_006905, partial [Penicillium lagena]|uniref:uncharacterized protein n=1 Tax=Penicillium lagena TaxID=94218 RepID=UPI002540BD9E